MNSRWMKILSVAAFLAAASVAWAEAGSETATYSVKGMTCGMCVARIKNKLKETPGVASCACSTDSGTCEVSFDAAKTSKDKVAKAITDSGFPATAQ